MENCYFDSGLGDYICEGGSRVSSESGSGFGDISLWVLLVALLLGIGLLVARYCYGVATRTGRSRVGFVWLSLFFPAVTLIICLILDKNDDRYTEEERNKYRLNK